jgi:hypothetical protein
MSGVIKVLASVLNNFTKPNGVHQVDACLKLNFSLMCMDSY